MFIIWTQEFLHYYIFKSGSSSSLDWRFSRNGKKLTAPHTLSTFLQSFYSVLFENSQPFMGLQYLNLRFPYEPITGKVLACGTALNGLPNVTQQVPYLSHLHGPTASGMMMQHQNHEKPNWSSSGLNVSEKLIFPYVPPTSHCLPIKSEHFLELSITFIYSKLEIVITIKMRTQINVKEKLIVTLI